MELLAAACNFNMVYSGIIINAYTRSHPAEFAMQAVVLAIIKIAHRNFRVQRTRDALPYSARC